MSVNSSAFPLFYGGFGPRSYYVHLLRNLSYKLNC